MRILLLGEYSGLHYNLAEGLSSIGHQVIIASDGDDWKDYHRDIDWCWSHKYRKFDIVSKLMRSLPKLRGFDVVQLINPIFINLKAEKNLRLFRYLKKHNHSVFLGANGDDFMYLKHALGKGYSTSVFNMKDLCQLEIIKSHIETKLSNDYRRLNEEVVQECLGITSCCTEYNMAYERERAAKLSFIPLPVNCTNYPFINTVESTGKVNLFLGIQEKRKEIKGMDILYDSLIELQDNYPNDVNLQIAKSVPFAQYQSMMDSSHILCDQLYSYGCGMNGAMAMSKGLIVAGGGEEEMYKLFGEIENKPIVNLPDTKQGVVTVLEDLIKRRDELPSLAIKSREFAIKHHDHIKVAQQYVDFWKKSL